MLERVVKASSKIVVPVLPSPFDLWATQPFLAQLQTIKQVVNGKADVALVGEEPHGPYQRPPLSKALWKGEMTPAELISASVLTCPG